MFWVYILKCADGIYYTGTTNNLETRVSQHNAGTFGGFTSTRVPVTLAYSQSFENVVEAINAERRIKRWSRKKKQALIAGKFNKLHEYAACRNVTASAKDAKSL